MATANGSVRSNAGRTIVVTGGGSGIGRATAHRLAAEGAVVAVWDIREGAARDVANAVGGEAFVCDVCDPGSVERAAQETVDRFGVVNGLLNGAGILRVEGSVEACSLEDWDRTINTNLRSIFLTGKYLIPHLRKADAPAIVNIASLYGLRGFADECAYDASKGGVVNLTHHMAVQYAGEGIRVNAVAPGEIETPLWMAMIPQGETLEQARERVGATVPMKRVGNPEEVAAVISFLLSEDASYVTGAVLTIDGGIGAG